MTALLTPTPALGAPRGLKDLPSGAHMYAIGFDMDIDSLRTN